MNIHLSQVERRSQLSSYLLAAFAMFTVLMFVLSLSHYVELQWSAPSVSAQVAQAEHNDLPAVIPVPLPPAVQPQAGLTAEPAVGAPSILVPQGIPVP